jgi:hypothetical protein
MGQGIIPLMGQICSLFPRPSDHRLEVYFTTELFSSESFPIPPETLMSEALDHFQWFDDPDLKCKFTITIGVL